MAAAGSAASRLASRTAARYLDCITAVQKRLAAVSSYVLSGVVREGKVRAARQTRPGAFFLPPADRRSLANDIVSRRAAMPPLKSLAQAREQNKDAARLPRVLRRKEPESLSRLRDDVRHTAPLADRPAAPFAPAVRQRRAPKTRPLAEMSPEEIRDTLVARSGGGRSLDYSLRQRLQPHLKFDPGLARLHTNEAAATAARSLRAEAFTIGKDVFFGRDRFAPASHVGMGLLAHELTHVKQQTGARGSQMRFYTATGGDALEREAQEAAAAVVAPRTAAPFGVMRAVDRSAPSAPKPGGEDLRMQDTKPSHASLSFALVMPNVHLETPPDASQSATGEPGASDTPSSAGSNAESVANRVYEIMKHEIRTAKLRGLALRKG
jgi:hypothetical protein